MLADGTALEIPIAIEAAGGAVIQAYVDDYLAAHAAAPED